VIIRVDGSVQQTKLLKQTPPVYPALARSARITGVVQLSVMIGKDGTVRQVDIANGPAELADAAMEAVRQWVYQPTLFKGEPVEVATTVNVNFSLRQ
jgi:protein TonB